MNNNLLKLLSVGMLASAPVTTALADVKIYGQVHAAYVVDDLDGQSAEQGIDDTAARSRIGFRAWEKLGNGMTALALLEFKVDPTTDSTNNLQNRQLWVALKHKKWGFIGIGTFHSPYKLAGVKLDPLNTTALQARGNGAMTTARGSNSLVNGFSNVNERGFNGILSHEGFVQSALLYKSPTWSKIRFEAIISPDEKRRGRLDGNPANNADGDDNDYAVAIHYNAGPIWAFVSWGENNIGTDAAGNNVGTEKAAKIGGKVKLGKHTVAAQYEWIDDSATLSGGGSYNRASNFSQITLGEDGEVWFLSYKYKAGNNDFVVQFGATSTEGDPVGDNDSEYFATAIVHHFSKKTRMYAGYSESDGNSNNADREVVAVGVRKDF